MGKEQQPLLPSGEYEIHKKAAEVVDRQSKEALHNAYTKARAITRSTDQKPEEIKKEVTKLNKDIKWAVGKEVYDVAKLNMYTYGKSIAIFPGQPIDVNPEDDGDSPEIGNTIL